MRKLQTIINDIWSCRREDYDCLAMAALSALQSGDPGRLNAIIGEPAVKAARIDPLGISEFNDAATEGLSPAGESVMVLRLRGFLFPEDTEYLIEAVNEADADPNVLGVVLDIDGPGGCASKVEQAAKAIRNCSKPVATSVTGYMASAHFWIGMAADRTFVASPLCRVGCLGVMQGYMSLKGYFEKNGIIEKDIYPDTADLKNHEARALDDKGDEEPLKKLLEKYHRAFAESVAGDLGIKVDMSLPLFRGETFMGDEAVALKYIDSFGGVDDAVKWVFGKATSAKGNSLFS